MKEVYVIHDQRTGEPYVGSAYGDTGIWARLSEYVRTMHGGNLALRELVDREGRCAALLKAARSRATVQPPPPCQIRRSLSLPWPFATCRP